jgi:hypothetical protein
MTASYIVRRNHDDTLDEIVASDCSVHLEQMHTSSWWMLIRCADGTELTVNFTTGRAPIRVTLEVNQ